MSARVAVIIPCYNDGPLLREAVESIVENEPIEIVVVDDHSTDPETLRVLDELRTEGIEVLRHERNSGSAAARGTALAASAAPFVFPLDADDLAMPGALAAMADRLEEEPRLAVCFGDYAEFGDSSIVRAVPDGLDPFRIAYTNEYPVSAMFRRTVLDEIGGWNGNGYSGTGYEDWNLWMTIAERADCCVHLGHGRLTYRRRLHGERKLARGKRRHPTLYRELARTHPRLFAELASHRRESGMSTMRKRLYPIVYGRRRRFAVEGRVKSLLDRLGIWTLRR
ncbi:MAG TPA: glycosyltransferase family A protein [Thermoleophilaceae bacterium]